jgi:hypothetical protein
VAKRAAELLPVTEALQASAAHQRADLERLADAARALSADVARSVEDRRSATRAHLGGVEPIPAPYLELLRAVLDAEHHGPRVQKTSDSCTPDLARDHQ